MPCIEMKELEASFTRYSDRRRTSIPRTFERRKVFAAWFRLGQARAAYIMQAHQRGCIACRCDS